MKVDGRHFRSIGSARQAGRSARSISAGSPHEKFIIARITTAEEARRGDQTRCWSRGAPLIGATAAYGMALAMRSDASDAALERAGKMLAATRPTAINLQMEPRWRRCSRLCSRAAHFSAGAAYAHPRESPARNGEISVNQPP